MLHQLFNLAKQNIDYFFEKIDIDQAEPIFDAFLRCRGVIFFTGVGKSGLVASKIAATMTSTGTKSLYVSPQDALHGDIGIVSPEDLFVFLSKSGESEELLQLTPFLRNKGVKLVAVVSKSNSRLSRACDLTMVLPFQNELCPFDLAPTTSSIIQLIFGDVMTAALMRKKHFTLDAYALNHPAGQIGKRSNLRVSDLMLKDDQLPLCHPEQKLSDVLNVMSEKRCGCLIVVDSDNRLQGIFTDGDLRRALQQHDNVMQTSMGELMTKGGRAISHSASAWEAMRKMEEDHKKPILVLPVVEEGRVRGLIKIHDLVQSGL